MTLYCPYCHHENEDPEIESLEEDEVDYIICGGCERNFSYYYNITFDFHGNEMEEDLGQCRKNIIYLKKRLELERVSKSNNAAQDVYGISYTRRRIVTAERELEDIEYKIEENKKKMEIKEVDLPF